MRPYRLLVSALTGQATGGQFFEVFNQTLSHPSIKEDFIMAKFYVQSGTLRAVVDSADAERAALWAVHTAMEQVFPLDCVDEVVVDKGHDPTLMIALAETIQLSEVGFDRDDSMQLDTLEAFQHWNQLFQAMSKLQSLLEV